MPKPDLYVEVVREDRRHYRLVLCAEHRGRVLRQSLYRPVRGQEKAEQRARELLTDLLKDPPAPEVVAVIRPSEET